MGSQWFLDDSQHPRSGTHLTGGGKRAKLECRRAMQALGLIAVCETQLGVRWRGHRVVNRAGARFALKSLRLQVRRSPDSVELRRENAKLGALASTRRAHHTSGRQGLTEDETPQLATRGVNQVEFGISGYQPLWYLHKYQTPL